MFQTAPQTFFELLQITPPCPCHFESLTIKTTEKRIDGILEPDQVNETIYFLEVQAFPDETIYWRTMREVSTYFEQRPRLKDNDWQAIVLWPDIADDPGLGTLSALAKEPWPRLVSANLLALLKQLDDNALSLNVLRPLVVDSEFEVRQNVMAWVENIQETPDLSIDAGQRLIAILSQFIEQRFKTLTYEELTKMLRLTPLRETTSFQEELKVDRIELLRRQIKKKFRFADSAIEKLTIRLRQLNMAGLEVLFEDILEIKTLRQFNAWLDDHISETERNGKEHPQGEF